MGVAQAAWFPNLSLTAAGGFASPELGDLFKWSARAWGVGALLSLPIFDGGRREAGVQGAQAQLDEALAGYREQVLVAFKDVEDQLSALRLLHEQAQAQARAVDVGAAAPRRCRTRATATAWSASWSCSTPAAASCATAARRCRCGPASTRRRWR